MRKPHALLIFVAATGTAIAVILATFGVPYGYLNYTAFAIYSHNGTVYPAPQMEVDCDTSRPGVQGGEFFGQCEIDPSSVAPIPIDVVVENFSGSPFSVAAFKYDLYNPQCMTGCVNGNTLNPAGGIGPSLPVPDATNVPGNWNCSSPPALVDTGLGAPQTSTSFLGCSLQSGSADVVPYSGFLRISRELFTDAVTAPTTIQLVLSNVTVTDDNGVTLIQCEPAAAPPADPTGHVSGTCFGATLKFLALTTATPTPSSTSTLPSTPTRTGTPTPTSAAVPPNQQKSCDPDETSTNVGAGPACNLFICQAPAACAGPGEGDLVVIEHVDNVSTSPAALGLGAYEFNVEFDSFVIQSMNPTDIIFSAGSATAGIAPATSGGYPAGYRGAPDCSMSIVSENSVRFGCVTSGQAAGPAGSFDLAKLDLVPAADDAKDLFPGNDNGIPTLIKDNQCELADALGHPVMGAGAGLLPVCGDLYVTVRILEGDLNLDCKVDLNDEALIASHYGAFFGSAFYQKWFDLEPRFHDLDIDIKDLQKVFGRDGSTCQAPVPAQTPVGPPFGLSG